MAKTRLLAVAAVVLLAAGCSSGSSSPTPAPVLSTPPATTAPSSAAASPAPCPEGAYLVTAFEGRGDASAIGKGSGGNIAADFTSGGFSLSSDGSQPVKLDLGAADAEMRFDGEISGRYEGEPDALQLRTTGAHGDVSVTSFGVTRKYSVGGVADQLIGSSATAQVTCDDAAGTAVVVLPNATLDLARRG